MQELLDSLFKNIPAGVGGNAKIRLNDEQLANSMFQPMIKFRPYLAGVFQRFLHAYRTL